MFHPIIIEIFLQSYLLLGFTFALVCSHVAPASSRTGSVNEGVSAVAIDQLTFYGDVGELDLAEKQDKKRVGEQLSPEMVTKPKPDFFRGEIIDDSNPIKKYDWSKEKGGKQETRNDNVVQPSKSTETGPLSKVEITTLNANSTSGENGLGVDTPGEVEPVSTQSSNSSMAETGVANAIPNETE